MATVRKGAPAVKAVHPIQKAVSRGVIEEGERARLLRRAKGYPAPARTSSNGASSGVAVAGATVINGGTA